MNYKKLLFLFLNIITIFSCFYRINDFKNGDFHSNLNSEYEKFEENIFKINSIEFKDTNESWLFFFKEKTINNDINFKSKYSMNFQGKKFKYKIENGKYVLFYNDKLNEKYYFYILNKKTIIPVLNNNDKTNKYNINFIRTRLVN